MALITCPECNQQISDQATSCPHCGYPLPVAELLTSDETILTTSQEDHASSETAPKQRRKRILPIVIACSLVLACIGGVAGFAIIKNQQEKAEQERAKAEARSEYIENLEELLYTTVLGAADAEEVCNMTKSVWYDTIYEEYDALTAPYTVTNGKFNDDFNVSLKKLYASDNITSLINDIKENQKSVDELYKSLLNPDDEFDACFEEVEALYNSYYDLTKLAVSPSGSLRSYSENFSDYDDEYIAHYDKLKLLIPEE